MITPGHAVLVTALLESIDQSSLHSVRIIKWHEWNHCKQNIYGTPLDTN